jgi:hypothetical protein
VGIRGPLGGAQIVFETLWGNAQIEAISFRVSGYFHWLREKSVKKASSQ